MYRVLRKDGFTIVELVVVIVVIGILATITMVAYNGATQRAQRSQALADLNQLKKGIMLAEAQSGLSLRQIAMISPVVWEGTSNAAYGGSSDGIDHPCPPDMTTIKMTNTTNECVIVYMKMIDRLQQVTGNNMSALKKGDPWGRPYVIDDEEGGSMIENCESVDRVSSADKDGWRADWDRSTGTWWKVTVFPANYTGLLLTVPRVTARPTSC